MNGGVLGVYDESGNLAVALRALETGGAIATYDTQVNVTFTAP